VRAGLAAMAAAACVAASADAASAAASQSPSSYPSCGQYRTSPLEPAVWPLPANRCILEARRRGRNARLVIVSATVEGDPIVTYIFVRGRMFPVLVVVDATRDDFGPRVWTQRECGRMTERAGSLEFGKCRTLRRGKPAWLKPVALKR
jgi:hypothetical protein